MTRRRRRRPTSAGARPSGCADVTGLDKEFDYAVPAGITAGGRHHRARAAARRGACGGWVVALDPADSEVAAERLQPVDRGGLARTRPGAGRARGVGVACAGPPGDCARSSSPPARRRTSSGCRRRRRRRPWRRRRRPVAGLVSGERRRRRGGGAAGGVAVGGDRRGVRRRSGARRDAVGRAGRGDGSGAGAAWLAGGGGATGVGARPPPASTSSSAPGPRRGRRAPGWPRWSWSTSTTRRCRRSAHRPGTPATCSSSGPAGPGRRVVATSPCPTVAGVDAVGGALVRFPVSSASAPGGRSSRWSTAAPRSRGRPRW